MVAKPSHIDLPVAEPKREERLLTGVCLDCHDEDPFNGSGMPCSRCGSANVEVRDDTPPTRVSVPTWNMIVAAAVAAEDYADDCKEWREDDNTWNTGSQRRGGW